MTGNTDVDSYVENAEITLVPGVRSATVNGKSGSLYPNERSSFRDFRLG